MIHWLIVLSTIIVCLSLGFIIGWLKGYNVAYKRAKDLERMNLVKKMDKWRKDKYKK